MDDILEVETLEADFSFKLRLEIYLRNTAIRIRARSNTPEKFDDYIAEREKIIRSMIGKEQSVSDKGKIIYP
ncbi:hypothetical protein [Cuniculiplasma divulgatum]|jgi:hypothetical protein|uniref:Uncharacterized protein n=1 Tax=Cuniculiplasma divulgatum TaxID=1673428 RepID=A0A1N5WES8_9ARCH|nr:hypothetical protein [Cuniculiplasma divulgatum]EQB67924.1 MAG: hypothetical protein AMDU5_GPLC00019G0010 [Thermoplasmatales archaeon Gpl]MCI2412935.1 hypothetical protein [Cuniculiplasma sp.]OWP55376.1 MAG: hypothetical protein B2I18_01275 [Cuniculiplasma sp. C_DKE]WMT49875.1 MAG: hypothetical protein RE472_02640 [Thermoplasmatales archaeon]SIM83067.1 hypothetical protein CSP5_1767 [Cuniculiplasma divulgatum]